MYSTFLVIYNSSGQVSGAEVVFNKKRVGGCGERRRGREKKHCYFLVVLLLVSLPTL